MSPAELLAEVRGRGVSIRVDGNHLRLRPRGPLTPDLLDEVRAQKPALIELLDSRLLLGQTLGRVDESEPTIAAADVCAMPLDQFAEARLIVRVRSEVLDEVVVFASDNASVDPGERRVVYRASELNELLGLDRQSLKRIHAVKRTFRGSVRAS